MSKKSSFNFNQKYFFAILFPLFSVYLLLIC
nr:MAG TPA: hypothetical protein [Caudoviricetes sp.]DAX44544.1 MAG TPA: hypothetical protein [Caudoviricetes sp.]